MKLNPFEALENVSINSTDRAVFLYLPGYIFAAALLSQIAFHCGTKLLERVLLGRGMSGTSPQHTAVNPKPCADFRGARM